MNRARWSDAKAPQPLRKGGATSVDEQAAAKLIEGYPPPPATQLTVQRIWQRVVNAPELRGPSNRYRLPDVLLLGASLALSLAVVGFVLFHSSARFGSKVTPALSPAPTAELAATRGGVFFSRPAERWLPGKEGQPLAEGHSVRTDPSGQAVMGIRGVASILIGRGTDVAIERLASGTYLRLSQGSVVARVSKRPPSEPFFILTHGFSVKVVGTLLQVDQDASDRTFVSVREGVVEVSAANGRSWRVLAGQAWSSGSPEQLGVAAITDPVKALLEDGLNRADPTDLDRELGEVAAMATGSSAGAVAPAAAPSLPHLSASPPNAEIPQVVPARNSPALALATAKPSTSLRSDEPPPTPAPLPPPPVILAANDPVHLPESGVDSPAPPVSAPASGAYADGLALERAGKVRAAAENFLQAEKSDPAHAELALYALGRLRQHRLRDPQGALEAFETYRKSYPNGSLLAEVDLAILEIDVAAGHRDQALAESVRFLASHPASERTVEVHLLRGDLLRERGNCRSALAEYRQSDTPAFAEEALFETAYCQRELGDAAAARESLRQYRQRYPAGAHRDDVAKALRE